MNFYIGVTDNLWYSFLRERKPDEVNFWKPGGQSFGVISEGEPFLFKLHSPQNYIVGGGFFVRFTRLPVSMTWKVFGEKNGASSYESFASKIFSHLRKSRRELSDPEIGCVILTLPFFFKEEEWIPAPRDWSRNIVSGKSYNTQDTIGREIWSRVQTLLERDRIGVETPKPLQVNEPFPGYGTKHLVETRLGQGAFRSIIIDAYNRRCAISGEKTIPVLEAAHIKPYSLSGPHSPSNGILLRSDLHILFDQGYISITNDLKVEVSKKIKEEYENGRDYYRYQGNRLTIVPQIAENKPSPKYLEWHQENLFKG